VLEAAADFGLKLAKGGRLIDTSTGEYRLEDIELEEGIALDAAAELKTPPLDKLLQCMVPKGAAVANPESALAGEGVAEAGVIVPSATSDGFPAGPISGWWPHGFNLRQLTLQSGAYVPMHTRAEEEVIFIQSGTLEVSWPDGSLIMGAGDTFTTPIGLPRAFRNTASVSCEAVVVRGGEDPARPVFINGN
jgi:mannose-6-phosphate isomerase-like protein (cupin superfamily)